VEILEIVLVFLRLDPRKLHRVALVCPRWCRIIIRCYLLWTYIPIFLSNNMNVARPESSLRFAEICSERSGRSNIDLDLTLSRISLYEDPHQQCTRRLENLVTKLAPRITKLTYRQYSGGKTLFLTEFPFRKLNLVSIALYKVSTRPRYIFPAPTRVERLELEGDIPYPLSGIDHLDLKALTVSWYGPDAALQLERNIVHYSALKSLELAVFGLLRSSSSVKFIFPQLTSLTLKDSSRSFCRRFDSVPALSHLSLSYPCPQELRVLWPVPTTLPWPQMPRLTTLTVDNISVEDVLAVVADCPSLIAIHFEGAFGFIALLKGLYDMRRRSREAQKSSYKLKKPKDAFPSLVYLRLNTIYKTIAPSVGRVKFIVKATKKLLEVWPTGRIATTAHPERFSDQKQWHVAELEKFLDHFDMRQRVEVLDAKTQRKHHGVPKLSEIFGT
ncbi:hypothetical protein DL93DRAFT_2087888, partial [Clavulina sp. PMI_390]